LNVGRKRGRPFTKKICRFPKGNAPQKGGEKKRILSSREGGTSRSLKGQGEEKD